MPSNEAGLHLTPEELSQYYAGELPDARAESIEDHLADCDRCTDLAGSLQNFGALWEGWTAQAHGDAMASERVEARERLQMALERAAGVAAEFGGRVAKWLQRLPRLPLSDILESVWLPGPMALEPGPILTHGEEQSRAVRIRLSRERWMASVSMPVSGTLEITVTGMMAEDPAPLTILTSSSGEGIPVVQQATWNEADSAWVTTLSPVPAGDYLAAIEP